MVVAWQRKNDSEKFACDKALGRGLLKTPAGQKFRFFRHELLQKTEGTVETARTTGDGTMDADAQPFDKYDALPTPKRSARVTGAQQQTDAIKRYDEGRRIEVMYVEDSRGDLEPATLDAIDHSITDDYTLEQAVPFEGRACLRAE